MLHSTADFGKTVTAQPGVDLRCGVQGKITQRSAGEQPPQVYGDQNLHRLAPADIGDLFRLKVLDGHHHGSGEEGGQADLVLVGFFQCRGCGKTEAGQVQESVVFRGAIELPGIAFPAAGIDPARIFEKTVFHFLGRRFFQPAEDTFFCRDGNTILLLQVFCHQTFQEDQSTGTVGKGMENLDGDPLLINDHTESALPHFVAVHPGQGVTAFFRQRGRMVQLLQIVPENTPAQPGADGGEPPHRYIQCGLQHRLVHIFRKGSRQAEHITPVLPPGSGINFRCVIQPHPANLTLPGHELVEETVDECIVLPVFL